MSSTVNGHTSHAQDPPVAICADSDDVKASPGIHLNTPSTFKRIEKNITHRIDAGGSILALVVSENDGCLIAGLQGGDVVAWSLDTYELILAIHAHADSVQALYLSEGGDLLFSCGSDFCVNVWSIQNFERLYSIHSHHDVGDLYSIVYYSRLNTVFCGSQAQSIQWCSLDLENVTTVSPTTLAGSRKHRFFDSLGPGGIASPKHGINGVSGYLEAKGGRHLNFDRGIIHHDHDQEILLTGGADGQIKLWSVDALNAQGLQELHKFTNRGTGVLSMAYSGTFLYTGMLHGGVHVYNLDSRQLVQKVDLLCGPVSAIQVIKGTAFCGTGEGYVKQLNSHFTDVGGWHSNNGKILASAIANVHGKDTYITGGNDNTVAFWDATARSDPPPGLITHGNDELVDTLRQFIAYKTVSTDPKYAGECNEAATFLRKLFDLFQAQTALLPTEHGVNPVLLARFEASNPSRAARTVLFYGHYDVVDAEFDPVDEIWLADPFLLHPLNGYLYGRGVTDNKGPVLAALYAAADLAHNRALDCNVVFLIEGEEESGSRGLLQTVQRNRERIGDVDCILLANSYWLDDHIPCLTYGMRGVVHATLGVFSDYPDRHSSMDGKATAHEPLKDLTALLGAITGPSGTDIIIPHFYDSIADLGPAEMQRYAAITSALMPGHPEIQDAQAFAQSLQQRWREPNLTIHRIDVPESKTAVTISRYAKANLSIRIVPGQDANQMAEDLTSFLKSIFAQFKSTNRLEIQITSKADAWLGDPSNEIFRTLDTAITEVWSADAEATSQRSLPRPTTAGTVAGGARSSLHKNPQHRRASGLASRGSFTVEDTPRKPLYIREGGSIPAISMLEKEFGAPAAMFPCGQASDNAHLVNERMRVENLYNAREVFRRVFGRLSGRMAEGEG